MINGFRPAVAHTKDRVQRNRNLILALGEPPWVFPLINKPQGKETLFPRLMRKMLVAFRCGPLRPVVSDQRHYNQRQQATGV